MALGVNPPPYPRAHTGRRSTCFLVATMAMAALIACSLVWQCKLIGAGPVAVHAGMTQSGHSTTPGAILGPQLSAPDPSPLLPDVPGGDGESVGALAAADVSFRMAYSMARSHGLTHIARCDLAGVLPSGTARSPVAQLEDALLVRVAVSMLPERTPIPVSGTHVYIPATPGGTAKVEVDGAAVTASFELRGHSGRRLGELGLLECTVTEIAAETSVRGRVSGGRGVELYVASCQGTATIDPAGDFVLGLALEGGEACELRVHEDRLGAPDGLRRAGPAVVIEGGAIPAEVVLVAPDPMQPWVPIPLPAGVVSD